MKRSLRRNNSGQVLIVSALLLALVLLSTALYVIQSEKTAPTAQTCQNDFAAYQQAAKSTLISALANVTNGGDSSVLASDLDRFTSAVTAQSYQSMLQLQTCSLTTAPYQDGLHISWGSSGYGISSACTDLNINTVTNTKNSSTQYNLTITTEIDCNGECWLLEGKYKEVNLTVNVYNEGQAALAENFTFLFDFDGLLSTSDWLPVNATNTVINNLGNGTYLVSLTFESDQRNIPAAVSVTCLDQRGIMVAAVLTFTGIEKP
ncbi:MAG: hypothetical protein NWF01_03255 [Candidatus Bathyarchaeota archaeon]|nr:hypothetical protein [Candidatus Bathyarchaeota archaeon]